MNFGDIKFGQHKAPRNLKKLLIKKLDCQQCQKMTVKKLFEILGQTKTRKFTYEVKFRKAKITTACVVTYYGITKLQIDVNAAFKVCGLKENFSEKKNVNKQGLLVNLNLYQQVAILKAIIAKYSYLKGKIGFYNLKGSRKAYEVLHEAKLHKEEMWWFWTGEKYIEKSMREESKYPKENLVEPNKLKGRFCYRDIGNYYWGVLPSNHCAKHHIFVLGGF
ncbi:hypothetical protein ACFL2K_02335 [Candidatus Margulisiibacteriota bacterium]